MADDGKVVVRKARRTGFSKEIRKWQRAVYSMAVPAFKYGIVPSILLYSVYYTEPTPTLLELLNPFF